MSILIQELVPPAQIEPTLKRIWEELKLEHKTRASLFNLIVFHRLSGRTDYLRFLTQRILEKFPCRILFITLEPEGTYLKTAVSVIATGSGSTACDQIDIGVTESHLDRIPSLLLPHLTPDLPSYLLWAEDPNQFPALFTSIRPLAARLIFDSESTDNLSHFARTILPLYPAQEIADLNWVRTLGWRDLFSTLFDTPASLALLKSAQQLTLVYNGRTTDSFCHPQTQALYLTHWLTSRLGTALPTTLTQGDSPAVNPGYLLQLDLKLPNNTHYRIARDPTHPNHLHIETPDRCTTFLLPATAALPSLVQEITADGTSPHFLDTLRVLK